VMQRSLKPQSTGRHRGDPPAFARSSARARLPRRSFQRRRT
jgi:hypothetical protein